MSTPDFSRQGLRGEGGADCTPRVAADAGQGGEHTEGLGLDFGGLADVRQTRKPSGPHFFMDCTALPLRGRLKGQRGVTWLCLKQTPSPQLPGLVACGGLALPSGCFQPLVRGKRVDTNKAPWSTCSEPDVSHFPDAGPACVGLRCMGPCSPPTWAGADRADADLGLRHAGLGSVCVGDRIGI